MRLDERGGRVKLGESSAVEVLAIAIGDEIWAAVRGAGEGGVLDESRKGDENVLVRRRPIEYCG